MPEILIQTTPAANDDEFCYPLTVAIGKQFPIPPEEVKPGGRETTIQKYFTQADHKRCKNMGQLLGALLLKAQPLPYNPTDEDRRKGKNAAPFVVLGGVKGGGSAGRLTAEEKADTEYSKQFTRCNETAAAAPAIAFDLDKATPEVVSAVFGNEFSTPGLLDDCGIMSLVYGSPRHTAKNPRIRAIIATSRLINPDEKAEVSLRAEQALMRAIGATRADKAGAWDWIDGKGETHRIEFDPTQYRKAQILFCPPKDGMYYAVDGNWLDVDALPELDEEGARQVNSLKSLGDHRYPLPTVINPVVQWCLDNDGVLVKPNFLAMPYNPYKSEDSPDGGTSFGLMIGDTFEECHWKGLNATFEAFKAECKAKGLSKDYLASIAVGMPEELAREAFGGEILVPHIAQPVAVPEDFPDYDPLPETALTAYKGKAAFLTAPATAKIIPFSQWNGNTGNDNADQLRAQVAKVKGVPLRFIPPQILPTKFNNDGECTAYKPINHADNFKWLAYRSDMLIARNLMTWQVEVFNRETGAQLTSSESKTNSYLIGQAGKFNLPKDLIKDHFDAVAEDCSYHPVARLFHGLKWDGVPRVQKVLDCVPVEDDLKPLRNELLKGLFAGAIGALDKGKIAMKYAPVLFSEENDWFKTSFFRRCFDVLPGAFKEGVSLDPTNKDSLRGAIFSWFTEFGELDGMTKKESAPLKTFMGKDCDEWRGEHKGFYSKKDRQTVYGGTVNKADFLKDETLSSRLPVIQLSAPVAIDDLNQALGWELVKGEPVNTDPTQLIQFWLEIKHMMQHEGLTHALNVASLIDMKIRNEKYVDKGAFYLALRDLIATRYQLLAELGHESFTTSKAADVLRVPPSHLGMLGKALGQLAKEGILKKSISRGVSRYSANEQFSGND